MGPTCAPFGGWSRLNQVRSPEGWSQSFDRAAPHGAFCGEVAGEQLDSQRAFACEQPTGSKLWFLDPWPKVLAREGTASVSFDQCRLGQAIKGVPAKKPTTLVSNCPEILHLFEGLICKGHHTQHADLSGGRCSVCQVWPWQMCRRLLLGIQRLKRRHRRQDAQAYPTTATGTGSASSQPPPLPPPAAPPTADPPLRYTTRAEEYARSS
eukprot:6470522-Amphidinium_carterae.1